MLLSSLWQAQNRLVVNDAKKITEDNVEEINILAPSSKGKIQY
jgi:hypothetical protein